MGERKKKKENKKTLKISLVSIRQFFRRENREILIDREKGSDRVTLRKPSRTARGFFVADVEDQSIRPRSSSREIINSVSFPFASTFA